MKKRLSHFPYNARSRPGWTPSTSLRKPLSPIQSTMKTVTYVPGTFVTLVPGPYNFAKEGSWPHRLAVVLGCATFPLLFIGGLVTSKGAGLAVPGWPTTFGYNMFFYPWSKMVGNIFYEHSHRLIAAAVGVLTIALTLTFWLQERRHWLRWLGAVALLLIILQGVIGGLRVVLLDHALAVVHRAFAHAFLSLA